MKQRMRFLVLVFAWLVMVSQVLPVTPAANSAAPGITSTVFLPFLFGPRDFLDHAFGSNGKVMTDLGNNAYASGLALQSDGRPVVVGNAGTATADFFVARYTSTGALDPSFGSSGVVMMNLGYSESFGTVAIQSDGKIVLVGQVTVSYIGERWGLVRLNPDGTLDASFLGGGKFIDLDTSGGASAVVIQSDGKLVVCGGSGALA